MDTLANIRTFLAVAQAGSFSAAGRRLGLAASVVSERVSRLEDQMRTQLLERSTRRLVLTETGQQAVPRFRALLAEIEDTLAGAAGGPGVDGMLRIKAPTSLAMSHLGPILLDFQAAHPGVVLDLVTEDRSVNPLEAGLDIALGALPAVYPNVVDEPICPYPRVLCAAPEYLVRRGQPRHPRELAMHDCLIFRAIGTNWSLTGRRGPVNVEVRARLFSNDSHTLHEAALRGLGIAMVARHVAAPSLAAGRLQLVLADYAVPELWIRALVPEGRIRKPAVAAVLGWLKQQLAAGLAPPPN